MLPQISNNIRNPDEMIWNHVSLCIINGGGVRASIDERSNNGMYFSALDLFCKVYLSRGRKFGINESRQPGTTGILYTNMQNCNVNSIEISAVNVYQQLLAMVLYYTLPHFPSLHHLCFHSIFYVNKSWNEEKIRQKAFAKQTKKMYSICGWMWTPYRTRTFTSTYQHVILV